MLLSSLIAALFASGVVYGTHFDIINACPSAITLYINGDSQGFLAANGGTTSRDFEGFFSGFIYTDANGGTPAGTSGTTRAGFSGGDNYYYIVVDPLGFNAGVRIIPQLAPTGGFCSNDTCATSDCDNAFHQPPTTFPPQSSVPPASPLAACPGGNPGYTIVFCPAGGFPALVPPHTIHPNGNANKCLEIRGDVRVDGTPVQIFDCNKTPAQNWLITRGETKVRLNGTNFCLDAGSTPANGVGMKIWTCFDDLPAQDWFYTGDNRIALTGQGQCLDLTNGVLTNANQMQSWHCTSGNTNQIWTI